MNDQERIAELENSVNVLEKILRQKRIELQIAKWRQEIRDFKREYPDYDFPAEEWGEEKP